MKELIEGPDRIVPAAVHALTGEWLDRANMQRLTS
jgi:hypothetical protein